jgi:hypothetical protein
MRVLSSLIEQVKNGAEIFKIVAQIYKTNRLKYDIKIKGTLKN